MNKEEKHKDQDQMRQEPVEGAARHDAKDTAGHHETHGRKKSKKSAEKNEELAQCQAKIDELNDKYLRLYSEFDNYRKRTLREKAEMSKTASEEIILTLLPVIDDLERALRSARSGDAPAESIPVEGIDLIYNKFKNILRQKGLEAIPALGEEFNVDYHDALTNVPVEQPEMKGKVVDEIERGYKLGEKVIRFAKVVVGS